MKKWALLLCFFFIIHIGSMQPGLLPDTLIDTCTGPIAIQQLSIEHTVVGYSTITSRVTETPVIGITSYPLHAIVTIVTQHETLTVSPTQKFYDPQKDQWILAKNISAETTFLNKSGNYISCIESHFTFLDQSTTAYELSLSFPHTFFIGVSQLLTHNMIPIAIGISFAFDGFFSGLTLSSIGVTLGGIIGLICFSKSEGWRDPHWKMPQWNPELFPKGPDDDEFTKKVIWFTEKVFEVAIKFLVDDNRLEHIFKEKHKFTPLLKQFGSQQNVVYEVLKAAHGKIPNVEGIPFGTDIKPLSVNVSGYEIYIRGSVVDGIIRISTMFIK
jgi:hypothetical protein